jgi:ankyrin repeat protein
MFLCLRILFLFYCILQLTSTATAAKTLHFAAETGDTARVRELLNQDAQVDLRDNRGRTALIYAASRGHLAIVNMLLAHSADIHAEGQHHLNPLNAAITRNHLPVVKRLIDAGADIHFGALDGTRPLSLAVEQGHVEIVKTLLANGANANTFSPENRPVLSIARDNSHGEIADLLLKHGADPRALPPKTLSVATTLDTVLIRKTLEQGVEPARALRMAVELSDTNSVRQLLEYGVDINSTTESNITPLMIATGLGNIQLVQTLLNAGADPFLQDDQHRTAYAFTIYIGNSELRKKMATILRTTMYSRQIH